MWKVTADDYFLLSDFFHSTARSRDNTHTPAIHVTAAPLRLTCSITPAAGTSGFLKATTDSVYNTAKDTADPVLTRHHRPNPLQTSASKTNEDMTQHILLLCNTEDDTAACTCQQSAGIFFSGKCE